MIFYKNLDYFFISNIIRFLMSKAKATEDKKSKGKVPNAYELNPQMMEQLSMITPENLPQFMLGNP
jgi:ABC-type phosphate transport system auxiliary subunit